jgi:ribosome-binding ATPase YchF (GTP1/OBG family)
MLSLALAGKPNAGKSTFYTAATMADVDVANYPFTTIDANRGVSHVRTRCPCLDRDQRCDSEHCRDGKRYVPVELLDVAGLVPGAHEGRGLGNQFLDELTGADAIVNVVDAAGTTDAEGQPVEAGTGDPTEDVDFVETEMDLWLSDIVARNWESVERRSRSPDFDLEEALTDMLTGFGATEVDVARVLRGLDYPDDPKQWADADREALAERLALRRAAEADVVAYDPGDEDFEVVGEVSDQQREGLEQVRTVMAEYGGTGVQQALNRAVYEMLDHVTVYPVQDQSKWTDGQGNVLPDAYLLPRGSTPTDLAYAVHSDIGDGYLHAVDAREGREVGESHELSEGDVVKIVSTAQ